MKKSGEIRNFLRNYKLAAVKKKAGFLFARNTCNIPGEESILKLQP
jgi:hypothetical protein